jgi:hypothetical protein
LTPGTRRGAELVSQRYHQRMVEAAIPPTTGGLRTATVGHAVTRGLDRLAAQFRAVAGII